MFLLPPFLVKYSFEELAWEGKELDLVQPTAAAKRQGYVLSRAQLLPGTVTPGHRDHTSSSPGGGTDVSFIRGGGLPLHYSRLLRVTRGRGEAGRHCLLFRLKQHVICVLWRKQGKEEEEETVSKYQAEWAEWLIWLPGPPWIQGHETPLGANTSSHEQKVQEAQGANFLGTLECLSLIP
jgi:hypothetical protein